MFHHHSVKFSQNGGKCHTVSLIFFYKKEGNVPRHSDNFSQNGGKCPTVIQTSFHKKEGNVPFSILTIFEIWEENFLESIMGDLNPRQIKSQEYRVQGVICSGRIFSWED